VQKRESAGRRCRLFTVKKSPSDLGGVRGQMISLSDGALAIELIEEANQNAARLASSCKELTISFMVSDTAHLVFERKTTFDSHLRPA
jgi:hypothetical protein